MSEDISDRNVLDTGLYLGLLSGSRTLGLNQAQTEGGESSDLQHRTWRDGMCWPGAPGNPECNKKAARSARAHKTRAAFLFRTTCRAIKPFENGEIYLNHETCSFESPTGAVQQLFQTLNHRSSETNI